MYTDEIGSPLKAYISESIISLFIRKASQGMASDIMSFAEDTAAKTDASVGLWMYNTTNRTS